MDKIDGLFARARAIVVFVVAVLLLTAILQNLDVVETRFLFATFSLPRAFLLALTAMGGFVIGVMVTLRYR